MERRRTRTCTRAARRSKRDGAVLDEESTTFGIRTIAVDAARGLRINGEPVELRGACIHHDNGVIGAATIARADERRVEILKEAGFNALRSAHHPMSREMLAACDRLGMLVMDEAFDMWTEQKNEDDYGRVFPDWWEADVDAMVRKDRNHPSVIMYSIGNEIPDTGDPSGARIGRAICERIRALDSTRIVTNSINHMLACGPAMFASLGEGAGAPSGRRGHGRQHDDDDDGAVAPRPPPAGGGRREDRRVLLVPRRGRIQLRRVARTRWTTTCIRNG